MVRTCLGCARKAFLPTASYRRPLEREREFIPGMEAERSPAEGSSTLEDSATENLRATGRGWVVQELLEAVHRCLFCGNNFITLI